MLQSEKKERLNGNKTWAWKWKVWRGVEVRSKICDAGRDTLRPTTLDLAGKFPHC